MPATARRQVLLRLPRALSMQGLITAPTPFSPQLLLRLPRAPAVVADAEAAATCLFDEFPSLCVVVISLPGIAIVARYSAGALIATDDLPCMQVLTTARSKSRVTPQTISALRSRSSIRGAARPN